MIVWGGYDSVSKFDTGGRYNPGTDTWTATSTTSTTSTTNAPSAREFHTAVWTGTEMIVWGGRNDPFTYLDTGGRYNPDTDSWTATITTDAASARSSHAAVWTGTQMIVWGGVNSNGANVNTGGRYCAQPIPPFLLHARVHRKGGKRLVTLTWSPADGGSVNVLRDFSIVDTTDDDGTAQDKLGTHTGIFYYQVCETDSGVCSNQVRVVVRETGE
jgi:hypothetical protein